MYVNDFDGLVVIFVVVGTLVDVSGFVVMVVILVVVIVGTVLYVDGSDGMITTVVVVFLLVGGDVFCPLSLVTVTEVIVATTMRVITTINNIFLMKSDC